MQISAEGSELHLTKLVSITKTRVIDLPLFWIDDKMKRTTKTKSLTTVDCIFVSFRSRFQFQISFVQKTSAIQIVTKKVAAEELQAREIIMTLRLLIHKMAFQFLLQIFLNFPHFSEVMQTFFIVTFTSFAFLSQTLERFFLCGRWNRGSEATLLRTYFHGPCKCRINKIKLRISFLHNQKTHKRQQRCLVGRDFNLGLKTFPQIHKQASSNLSFESLRVCVKEMNASTSVCFSRRQNGKSSPRFMLKVRERTTIANAPARHLLHEEEEWTREAVQQVARPLWELAGSHF